MTPSLSITLVGCGKMGSAMLRGWVASKISNDIAIIEPAGLPTDLQDHAGVKLVTVLPPTDVVILAVKPQIMESVCQSLAPQLSKTTFVLSIAAGQKIANFEKVFGNAQPVIRAIPNTPAAIGAGITIAVANANISNTHRTIATQILAATGKVEWVTDESLMDAVTALSGSGPAYIFHLIEAMAKAGVECGLDPAFAMTLARETVIGSALLAKAEPQTSAEQLRKNVTSPGGTTEAALNVLMPEMADLFTRALKAATLRSKELSSS